MHSGARLAKPGAAIAHGGRFYFVTSLFLYRKELLKF